MRTILSVACLRAILRQAHKHTPPKWGFLPASYQAAPKINLICPVSARICADPLHCRPSIEYASASFKEVRTPASPNPLSTYPYLVLGSYRYPEKKFSVSLFLRLCV